MKLKTLCIIQSIIIVALGVALATCYHQKQEVSNDLFKTSQKLELATKLHERQTSILSNLNEEYPATFRYIINYTDALENKY